MNQQNFNQNKRDAIKRMQEMQAKSIYKQPEKPKSKEQPPSKLEPQQQQSHQSAFREHTHSQIQPQQQPQSNLLGGLNLPFLENLKTDGDLTLILGILLLLLSEKADKRLLFALIYILL